MKNLQTDGKHSRIHSSTLMLAALALLLFSSWRMIEYKIPGTVSGEKDFDRVADLYNDDWEQVYTVSKAEPQMAKPVKKEPEISRLIVEPQPVPDASILPEINAPTDTVVKNPDNIVTLPPDDEDVVIPLIAAERPPVFPGCEVYKDDKAKLRQCFEEKLRKFVRKHFDAGVVEKAGISGKTSIYVVFTIDKQGKVADIRIRSSATVLEKEARKTICSLPVLKPALQTNKPVKVTYALPIILSAD